MRGIVLNFFWLILRVSFKLTPNAINKNLEVFKVLLEEIFEIKLYDRSGNFVAVLMLSLSKPDDATKILGNKRSIIDPGNA